MIPALIIIDAILVPAVIYIMLHRKLDHLRRGVPESWAAETTLRRYELTAHLIEIAKAHAIRGRGTLDAMI